MPGRWEPLLAARARRARSSTIRELLKVTSSPGMISFAGGLPGPDVFPIKRVLDSCERVLSRSARIALQYSETEGYLPLREWVAGQVIRYGLRIEPRNVLVTSGSQQALDMLARTLVDPGDHIAIEAPTYLGFLQAFDFSAARYFTVPLDQDGMQVDRLEMALRGGAKLIYALPNFHNPAGVTLSLERRMRLVEMARHYEVPIIEDDPYGQLRYEGAHLPPLYVLDQRLGGRMDEGNVVYLSTFSKTVAPGLRLGWIIAPAELISRLVILKQGMDLHSSTFTQAVAHDLLRDNFLAEHVPIIRREYALRRDAMLAALESYFPAAARWTRPAGGLFLWVTLPGSMDERELFDEALRHHVAFVPGYCFYPEGREEGCHMRLNFSYADPARIIEGIRLLGRAVEKQLVAQETAVIS